MNFIGIAIPAAVIAIAIAGVLVFRSRSRRPPLGKAVDAELFPRTLLTFVPRRRLLLIVIMAGTVLLVSVVAGLNAVSAGDGKTMHYEFGIGGTARTLTYGWYDSVPSLALLTVLLGVAAIVLSQISRPAIGSNRERDIDERRRKSAIVATTVAGAVAMHASLVFVEAAGAASLSVGVLVDGQSLEVGGPFAVFTPVLVVAGIASAAYGAGAWSYLFWLGTLQPQRSKMISTVEGDN